MKIAHQDVPVTVHSHQHYYIRNCELAYLDSRAEDLLRYARGMACAVAMMGYQGRGDGRRGD